MAVRPAQRLELLESYLRNQLARALRVDPARLDPNKPLNTLGLDSLTTVELKNSIEASLGVSVPIASLLQGPSLSQLTEQVLDCLLARPLPADEERLAELMEQVERLSEEEVKALLNGD
jgi:acyl carrier protein